VPLRICRRCCGFSRYKPASDDRGPAALENCNFRLGEARRASTGAGAWETLSHAALTDTLVKIKIALFYNKHVILVRHGQIRKNLGRHARERNQMEQSRRRVLVIEDDHETAAQLVDCLQANAYCVDLARDGEQGLILGREASYAVLTIDRMLPQIEGIDVIRRLRQEGVSTPALILSALGEVDDRVRGLRAGGDDYLVKPFAFSEMLARVDALARRSATVVKDMVLRAGDLELDLLARTARRSGREIALLPREFQLLEYLVRNIDQVVSRTMLLEHVWDLHFDPTTNVIDVYVGRVRRKVDTGQEYPLIHTVRGVGFCLRAPR
jgi:two-component system, OmpR family, response regulator